MSVLTGVVGGFDLGAEFGGPVVQVYGEVDLALVLALRTMTPSRLACPAGWIAVCFFSMFVAVSMAEICSSYPTAGGLYYWSAQLAGRRHSALASWVTGCAK